MEIGGNKHINAIFEGKNVPPEKPEPTADQETRQNYIRSKYVDRKFFSPKAYAKVGKEEIAGPVDIAGSAFRRINENHSGFSPVNWNAFPPNDKTAATKIVPRKDQLSISLHENSQRTRTQDLSQSWHSKSGFGSKGRQNASKERCNVGLNDESSSDKRRSVGSSDGGKSASSGSRGKSSRSRSTSLSSGRKRSDRGKRTSSHSIQLEDDNSDGGDSFGEDSTEKSAENSVEKMHASAQTFDVLNNSQDSLGGGESNVVTSSSRYRKGSRRMPRGEVRGGRGRGALSRALSVPDFKARPQGRRRDEKRGTERRDDLVSKLKEVLPAESEEKILELLQAVETSTGSKTSSSRTPEQKSRSGRRSSGEKDRSSGQSSEQRSRGSSRSRSSDQRRRRSSSRKRGVRRQTSSSDVKQRSSRSKSGDRRRRRSSSDDGAPVNEGSTEERAEKKSSGRSPLSSSNRSGGSEPSRRNRLPNRSKSDDLGLHFSLNQSSLPPSQNNDDGLSITTEMKPSVVTEVRRKVINPDAWLDDVVEEFSDEDLFAGTDEKLLSESEEEEEGATVDRIVPRRTASMPIKLMKDAIPAPTLDDSPRPSIDIAALTFYN
jgi:hypothetical protein